MRLQHRCSLCCHKYLQTAPSSRYNVQLSLWIMCAAAVSLALVLLHSQGMHAVFVCIDMCTHAH